VLFLAGGGCVELEGRPEGLDGSGDDLLLVGFSFRGACLSWVGAALLGGACFGLGGGDSSSDALL